jgi:hypothetical protein
MLRSQSVILKGRNWLNYNVFEPASIGDLLIRQENFHGLKSSGWDMAHVYGFGTRAADPSSRSSSVSEREISHSMWATSTA